MGRLREVCGAVSATFMIAGLKFGYTDPKGDETKARHYALIQSIAAEFKEKHGSFICRELLGLSEGADSPKPEARTKSYYDTRPCAGLVESAAAMIEEVIQEKTAEERL